MDRKGIMGYSDKIRVLQTIRQGKIGGGESHVLDLVSFLDKDRFDTMVLSFTDGPMMESLKRLNIPGYVIASEKPFDIRVWRKVKAFMKEQRIDIVHVHGTRANTNVLWAARSLKLPVLYTIHGWSFHDGLSVWSRRARIAAEKFITRRTSMNICVSDANQVTGNKEIGNFNSIVIKNGVNLHKFDASGVYEDLRIHYNIPQDHLVIGYVVRMTYQKDPFSMLQAFSKVAAQLPKVTLLMVGDGDLKEEVLQMAKVLRIMDRVIFDNFRQDIPAVLKAIDIYCLPSLWEGFPIGVLEAMAMGKTVIASDVDGTKEAVSHMVNGCLVPARKPESLAAMLLRLAEDPILRARLEENAVKTVRSRYNVEFMTKEIERVYRQFHKA